MLVMVGIARIADGIFILTFETAIHHESIKKLL